MKNLIVSLGICGAITLSFFSILLMEDAKNNSPLVSAPVTPVHMQQVPESSSAGGSEAGAPEADQGFTRLKDAERKSLSARFVPGDASLVVALESGIRGEVRFRIFDMSGMNVFTHTDLVDAGDNHYLFSLRHAAAGIYFIEATYAGQTRVTKVNRLSMPA